MSSSFFIDPYKKTTVISRTINKIKKRDSIPLFSYLLRYKNITVFLPPLFQYILQ